MVCVMEWIFTGENENYVWLCQNMTVQDYSGKMPSDNNML